MGFGVLLGFGLYLLFLEFLFEWAVGKLIGWFSSPANLLFRFAITLNYLKIDTTQPEGSDPAKIAEPEIQFHLCCTPH